jgi:nucleoside-diphosphate-sugar epimerase
MKVLVTGVTGFIGKALFAELLKNGFDLTVVLRKKNIFFIDNVNQIIVSDLLDANVNWRQVLENIDCIVHLAGKAHVVNESKEDTLGEFRKINTNLTLNLAEQAAEVGVKRFVFLSSIGVNGNQNSKPFIESDIPNPQDSYAVSKYEAEQGLFKISKKTGLEIVIIRPPLVYGANAPGNFGRLLCWVRAKFLLPLPLGAVNNQRSLVAIDNLVDFIVTCIVHKDASNEIFLISDDQDLSTTQLLRKIAIAFEKRVILLPISVRLMTFMASFLGRGKDANRLFSSLQVDSSKAQKILGWHPKTTIDNQLKKIAQ